MVRDERGGVRLHPAQHRLQGPPARERAQPPRQRAADRPCRARSAARRPRAAAASPPRRAGGPGRRRAARDRGDRLARLSRRIAPRRAEARRARRAVGGLHGALHLGYDGRVEGGPAAVRALRRHGRGGVRQARHRRRRPFLRLRADAHGGADVPIYAMLRAGGSVAIVQGFRTDTFWDEVRRWGCTVAWIHSAMSIFLAKAPPQDDDGDNPLRLAHARADVRGHARLREALRRPLVLRLRDDRDPAAVLRRGSHRPPNAREAESRFQVSLVDEHDYEVEVGVAGELLVRHERPWC